MRYTIRHKTTFEYDAPIAESVMELRMRPATTAVQRCLQFEVTVEPDARVFAFQDARGNWVHHFNVPQRHERLAIAAQGQVDLDTPPPLPGSMTLDAWERIDRDAAAGEEWDFQHESAFTPWSDALVGFATSLGEAYGRSADPLTTVRRVMGAIHRELEYVPKSTRVDS